MRTSSLAGFGVLLLANACSLLFPVPDASETADAGVASADGSAEGADARTTDDGRDGGGPGIVCAEDVRGPKLAPVDTYCIDRTPVSVAQYREFQDAGVPLDAMPPGCETNRPYQLSPLQDGGPPAPDTAALVDWCEAYVYCQWAGKRLCGAVDGGRLRYENMLDRSDAADQQDKPSISDGQQNAWLHACVGPTNTLYPYGNDFEPDACVPGRPVGQPTCQGGYPGIFDLVGNRGEFVDAFKDDGVIKMNGNECRSYSPVLRVYPDDKRSYVVGGIRCCWP